MDDLLETPSASLQSVSINEDDTQSDEEDGGLDWTKLLRSSARPVIPKRGEKEYEPRVAGGSNLQIHVLDQSRNAMFETLRTTRSISSKAVSYAIWHAGIARTEVTLARGIHFANMGHSAPRITAAGDNPRSIKTYKRLELLPEEAIYLIERGALFCWKATNLAVGQIPGLNDDVLGSPMSVQQAYSEMIGREGMTLERFQVFSYLKRLGYVVTRAEPPDPYYPTPSKSKKTTLKPLIMHRIISLFASWKSTFYRIFFPGFNWWRPLRISRWFHHDRNYASIFSSLRFIPAGHHIPVLSNRASEDESPYKVFYHVYKPSSPFKKSSPHPPDFYIVVVNARSTPMPNLQELTNLFNVLPEITLPLKPRRPQFPQRGAASGPGPDKTDGSCVKASPSSAYVGSRIWTFIQRIFYFSRTDSSSSRTNVAVPPKPFMALKTGKKEVVVAAVDMGNISFFKFAQGAFSEWPMM